MAEELDVDAMIKRFRERARAVHDRALPPVAGEERRRFIERAELDYMDFGIIGDATGAIKDGILTLRVDLRPPEARILLGLAANRLVIGGSFTDAATGLNVRVSATPARKVEGGYVVSGRKSFCSLAPVLDIFYGTASVVGAEGAGLLLFALPRDA